MVELTMAQELVDVITEAVKTATKEGQVAGINHMIHAILRSKTGSGDRLRYTVEVAYKTLAPAIDSGMPPEPWGLPPIPPTRSKNPREG